MKAISNMIQTHRFRYSFHHHMYFLILKFEIENLISDLLDLNRLFHWIIHDVSMIDDDGIDDSCVNDDRSFVEIAWRNSKVLVEDRFERRDRSLLVLDDRTV